MTEHLIWLRGGWGCRPAGLPESAQRPLILPVRWSEDTQGRLILTRRFGRPRVVAASEVLLLRMEQVDGIVSLSLNGQPITLAAGLASAHEIELDKLSARNLLVLEVETPEFQAANRRSDQEWGFIALVVRSLGAAEQPRGPAPPYTGRPPGEVGEINLE